MAWNERVPDGSPLREDMPTRSLVGKPALNPEQIWKAEAAAELQGGQGLVFLGLCGKRHQAKVDAVDNIDDLRKAGIRFMHFTGERQRKGLAFAERLGLDADWNCCISLEDPRHDAEEAPTVSPLLGTVGGGEESSVRVAGVAMELIAPPLDESAVAPASPSGAGDQGDESDESSVDLNTAKLPQGLNEIKEHIEVIDDWGTRKAFPTPQGPCPRFLPVV